MWHWRQQRIYLIEFKPRFSQRHLLSYSKVRNLVWHIYAYGIPVWSLYYRPKEKKQYPMITSGYFIGYAKRYKGYKFHCPSNSTRIVKSRNAKFLENDLICGSGQFHNTIFVRDWPSTSSQILIIVHNNLNVQYGDEQSINEIPQDA